MKKFIIVFAFVLFAAPMFASAHPNLSQFPISTGRPVVTVPTAPTPSTGGSFGGTGIGCQHTWEKNGVLEYTPCHWDIMLAMIQLANLK